MTSKQITLQLLSFALLEIRLEAKTNPAKAADLADLFHNLPTAMMGAESPADWDALLARLQERATRKPHTQSWLEHQLRHNVRPP